MGHILVCGHKIDLEDARYDYVCATCGAKLIPDGIRALRCTGPERHYIDSDRGLANKPDPHNDPNKKRKQGPKGKYIVDGKSIEPRALAEEYRCAHCLARLERIPSGGLRCTGAARHPIESGADVIERRSITYEFLEAREYILFQQGFEFWFGERAMARLKDRNTISNGLKRAGKIRLGYFTQLREPDGTPKFYKGGKKKGKPIEAPVNVDYFVLKDAPAVANAYQNYPSAAQDLYGSGPTELLVYLPFDDVERIFSARYEWRKGRILYCAGDGETIQYALSRDGRYTLIREGRALFDHTDEEWALGKKAQVRCSGEHEAFWPRCADCSAAEGKAAMTLRVMVRDPRAVMHDPHVPMPVVNNEWGYYEIHTGSRVTYDLLVTQLDKLAAVVKQAGGRLTGVPMRLTRVPTEMSYVQKDRDGTLARRATVTHALLNIEPDPEWVRAMMGYMHQKAVLAAPASPAPILPPGEDEVFDGEFTEADDPNPPLTLAQRVAATQRPWPPDLLKEVLLHNAAKKIEKGVAGEIGDATRKAATDKLDGIFDGDPGQRLAFIAFVFGVEMSTALSQAQGEALADWLGGNGHVAAEARALVALAQHGVEQAGLPL